MKNNQQRLYWSVSKPLRWLGLAIDEWALLLGGFIPGIFMVNGDDPKMGLSLIVAGGVLCYAFKKFKKLSEYFILKSYLLANGLISPPSKSYPHMLHESVGK